jgi:hypothetical protein
MRRALSRSIGALSAAIAADVDRTDEDRAFFAAERAKLEPIAGQLKAAHLATDDFELGPGEVQQAQVELGDQVLDRGVRAGNTRTKLGVKGKQGLDATHAFGQHVDDLTGAPLALEPAQVLLAASRLDDLPPFAERASIQQDLTHRAEQQDTFLKQRDAGATALLKLESEATRLVVESALSLASLKGSLDARFPRQRSYVAAFFLDVSTPKRKKADPASSSEE